MAEARNFSRNVSKDLFSFHFELPQQSLAVLQYIKGSPEHYAKLEDEMKDVASIYLNDNSVFVKPLSSRKQENVQPWDKKCRTILREFFKEYSVQIVRVNYFVKSNHQSGPSIKILQRTSDNWIEVQVVGIAKDVAKKIHELKTHDKNTPQNMSDSGQYQKDLQVPNWLFKHVQTEINDGEQKWPKVELKLQHEQNLITFSGEKTTVEQFYLHVHAKVIDLLHIDVSESFPESSEINIEEKKEDLEAAKKDVLNTVDRSNEKKVSYRWQYGNKYVLNFIKTSASHNDKLQKYLAQLGTISITDKGVAINGLVSEVEKQEWERKCIESFGIFFSNYCTQVLIQSDLQRLDINETDVKVIWTGNKWNAVVSGLNTSVEKKISELQKQQSGKNRLIYRWQYGNKQVLDFLKNSAKHHKNLRKTLSKLGDFSVTDKEVRIYKMIPKSKEKEWNKECLEALRKFFSDYASRVILIQPNVERLVINESDVEVIWPGNKTNAVVSGLKTSVERKIEELQKQQIKTVCLKWSYDDEDVLEFVKESDFHFQQLQIGTTMLGSVVISENCVEVTGKVMETEESQWQDECKSKLQTFFSKYSKRNIEFNLLWAVQRIDVTESNWRLRWTEDKSCAIISGVNSSIQTISEELLTIKEERNVVYSCSADNAIVFDFIKQSQTHREKMLNQLAHLGSLFIEDKEVTIVSRHTVFETEVNKWQQKCKEVSQSFFSNYTSYKMLFHPNLSIERKDINESDVAVSWSGNKTEAIICGLITEVKLKVAELENPENEKTQLIYRWRYGNKQVLDFLKNSAKHNEELQKALFKLGYVSITDKEVRIFGAILKAEEKEWNKECLEALRGFFSDYVSHVILIQPIVARVNINESDVEVFWPGNKANAVVSGLKTSVERKIEELQKQEIKTVCLEWSDGDENVLGFVKDSDFHFQLLQGAMIMMATGSVVISNNCVEVVGEVIAAEESEWQHECKSKLQGFFLNYSKERVEFSSSFAFQRMNVIGPNCTLRWTEDKTSAIICGENSEVRRISKEISIQKAKRNAVYRCSCGDAIVFDFIVQSRTHREKMQNQLKHLGSLSIEEKEVVINSVLFVREIDAWKKKCKAELQRFVFAYKSHKMSFHANLSIEKKDVNETDVKVSWPGDKTQAVICGLKTEVDRKIDELTEAKNAKIIVNCEWNDCDNDVLDFVKDTEIQFLKLEKYMEDMGSVVISHNYCVIVSGEESQLVEEQWRTNCEKKLQTFFQNYSKLTIPFHPLSSVARIDATESTVWIRWTGNKMFAIVCGENSAVQSKVAAFSKAKNKQKNVSYKWHCDEESLLSFVKESTQQLEEFQEALKNIGSPVISHENITINGEILETLPGHDWEKECEKVITNYFSKYSVEKVEVPPMAMKKAHKLQENGQDVIARLMEDCNSLIVFGLSDAVKLKVSSIMGSLAKIQKEEEERLKKEQESTDTDKDFNDNPGDADTLVEMNLVLPEEKAKCLQAYKASNTKEFVDVDIEILRNGIRITGKKNDVEKVRSFSDSIVVDKLIIQKYGAYQFLIEHKFAIEVIGIKYSCNMLLVQQIQNAESGNCVFKHLSDDDSDANPTQKSMFGHLTVEVKEGDITDEITDMIVNTTDSSFTYGGPLSKSILSKAGYDVLSQCVTVDAKMKLTPGGELACQTILHVAIPAQHEKMDNLITNILILADTHRMESITLPTIGAGGGGWTSDDVAKGIHDGILEYVRLNQNFRTRSLKNIIVVLFRLMGQQDKLPFYKHLTNSTNIIITSSQKKRTGMLSRMFGYLLRSRKSSSTTTTTTHQSSSSFAAEPSPADIDTNANDRVSNVDSGNTSDDEGMTSSIDESAKILISDHDKDNVEKAKAAVAKLVGLHLKEFNIIDPVISRLKLLQMDEMKKIATDNNVKIVINCRKDNHSINIQGRHENASKSNDEVRKILNNISTDFPDCWEQMDNDEKLKRVTLVRGCNECSEIETLFLKANASGYSFTVIRIERIQNPGLYKQYQSRKQEVSKRVKNSTLEQRLFHGTARDTADHICSDGFDRGFAGTANAAMYGKGVYFSSLTSYSHAYTTPASHQERQMFLAHVLTGDYCVGDDSMRAAPKNPKTKESYDSVVDSQYNPSIFVVFKDASVYPTYVITYICK